MSFKVIFHVCRYVSLLPYAFIQGVPMEYSMIVLDSFRQFLIVFDSLRQPSIVLDSLGQSWIVFYSFRYSSFDSLCQSSIAFDSFQQFSLVFFRQSSIVYDSLPQSKLVGTPCIIAFASNLFSILRMISHDLKSKFKSVSQGREKL